MYFKRIDIQGFKSFAEPISIDFHEGITCVVGPNGSGKSNISDAIRWVLGEQSPKMLRGGKMEEVIFSGTANRKSRGMAEVTLVIDNSKGILPIDYAEVAITRRMYRSGESEYAINKGACRLRDIREMIMDTGIGVDGYSIIGQGKIADIVSNKPESRREIFEEAAGIVKYRAKKIEAERKLETSKSNMERVSDIIGELESRIGGLRVDSEKAKEYLELRQTYKVNEVNIVLKTIESIELKNEYIQDDLLEQGHRIDDHKKEKGSVDQELVDSRGNVAALEQSIQESGDQLLKLLEEINQLSGESQLRREKMVTLEKDRQRIESEMEERHAKLEKERASCQEVEERQQALAALQQEIRAALQEKSQKQGQAARRVDETTKGIDANKDRMYELHSRIAGKQSEANSLKNLCDALNRRNEGMQEELETVDTGDGSRIKEQEDLQEKKNALEKHIQDLDEKIRDKSAERDLEMSREKEWKRELEEERIRYSQTATRLKTIEEMERAYEGYNYGVRFLMRDKPRGILGTVADLLTVPEGYETAMETALGPALQNVICREEEDAQKAIEALKKNKAGRLTFLPLARIRGYRPQYDARIEKEPGFLGFGVDCVTFDEAYRPAIEYLLGRTVIVRRLEDARKLSQMGKGGLRFVTLEGEVVNAAGAMTGGAYNTNTAGLLERKTEAKRLAEDLVRGEKSRDNLEQQIRHCIDGIAKLNGIVETLLLGRQESEHELIHQNNALESLTEKISNARENRSRLLRERENIDQEVQRTQAMIREILESVQEMEFQSQAAEKEIEDLLRRQEQEKKELEEMTEENTTLRLKEGSIASEKENLQQTLHRINSYIKEQESAIQKNVDDLAAIGREKEHLSTQDDGSAESIEAKEKERHILEVNGERMRDDKARTSRHVDELQVQREKMDETLMGLQTEKQELEWKLSRNISQVETHKEKLWEEFEVSYVQAMEFRSETFVLSTAQRENRQIRSRMRELGDVNVGAIKEYEQVNERYEFLSGQKEDLVNAMAGLIKIIEDMDRTIRRSFSETFDQVAHHFGEAFRELFGGGAAELRLEDPQRPLDTGIEIVAQPPGKKLQNINLMSGGEKTMTAIALMFAVLKTKPTPFCIFDEVEAALDDSNIDRFITYLKGLKDIQFTLVTHQKATMEHADVLYGVTMPEQGISKVISLKLEDAVELQ